MPLAIETFVLGPLQTNTYLLSCEGACWVVDPGWGVRPLLRRLERDQLQPQRILLTHGHGDHLAGAGELKERYPEARVCCPEADQAMLADAHANLSASFALAVTAPPADELIRPGSSLRLGGLEWLALDTSGHTRGGLSYYCAAERVVLTGDALFAGSVGRTDIPGGSAYRLLKHVRENLLTLPPATRVLPGHGPETTLEAERRENPFFADKG